jgi:Flp pilus assembly pilin Flp
MSLLWRFLSDDSGEDLVEYALLTATVGAGAAAALSLMPGAIDAIYTTWDTGTQDLWEPCDPGVACR